LRKYYGKDHWSYNSSFDEDIERIYRTKGYGAIRIYKELKMMSFFNVDISIPTIARRLREIKARDTN